MFTRAHYAISPDLVRRFGNTGWFRKLWRGVLDRMVRRRNGKVAEIRETARFDRLTDKQASLKNKGGYMN